MTNEELRHFIEEEIQEASERAEDDEWWEGYVDGLETVLTQLNT